MKLKLIRIANRTDYCIGRLYIEDSGDWQYFCDTLEPRDYGLTCEMSPAAIKKIKQQVNVGGYLRVATQGASPMVYCAIPTGTYPIAITFSPRFKQWLPLLINVPGFSGVRIHAGNSSVDTQACILPGENRVKGYVYNSRKHLKALIAKLTASWSKDTPHYIEIERKYKVSHKAA